MVEGQLEDLRRDRAVFINIDQARTTLSQKRIGGVPLKVGDRLAINDNEAIIAGTYKATREFFWDPVIYTTYSRALSWAPPQRKLLSFILVKAKPDVPSQELANRIHDTTGLSALTNAQFVWGTTTDLLDRTGILINFGITIALGFVIGVLIAGQTFYMFVLDNLKYFATLKAMGTRTATLVKMLFLQTVTVGLVGFGIGAGAAVVGGVAFSKVGLAFSMTWPVVLGSVAAIIVCCGAAAMLGLKRVISLEAGIVFRS
jgi:putative ABC transport system permease protein